MMSWLCVGFVKVWMIILAKRPCLYKFQADLHKYCYILNIEDYFMIQIKLEWCLLKTIYKLQMSSARPFKVLQMIESNS